MEQNSFPKMLMKLRHIAYDEHSFKVQCPICGEPVTPDKSISIDPLIGLINEPNASCKVHGRVKMPYDGKLVKGD